MKGLLSKENYCYKTQTLMKSIAYSPFLQTFIWTGPHFYKKILTPPLKNPNPPIYKMGFTLWSTKACFLLGSNLNLYLNNLKFNLKLIDLSPYDLLLPSCIEGLIKSCQRSKLFSSSNRTLNAMFHRILNKFFKSYLRIKRCMFTHACD